MALKKDAARTGGPVRDRLFGAAARLFRNHGYAGTTTRQLAAELGVQSASLYHYFGQKEDLLLELSVAALQRILDGVREGQRTQPGIESLIRAHLAASLQDQDAHAVMLMELRSLSPGRRATVLELRHSYEALVREIIEQGQARGEIRADIPSRHIALALLNLLNWAIFWYRPEGELTPDRLASVFMELFLDGARGR